MAARQIYVGTRQFAAEEAGADFRARPRQAAARRLNKPCHERRNPEHPRHLPLSGEGPFARAAHGAPGLQSARRCRPTGSMPSRTDPPASTPPRPRYQPKQRYLMLMRNERLARLRTRYRRREPHAGDRTRQAAKPRAATCSTPDGRATIERFFADFCADELRGPPRCCTRRASASPTLRARWSRSSTSRPWPRSKIGGRRAGRSAALSRQPLRHAAGRPGASSISSGRRSRSARRARLKIVKRIVRCAATNVDPDTGIRDLSIPHTLMRSFGHADCGVYGEVVNAGEIVRRRRAAQLIPRRLRSRRPSVIPVCSARTPPARRAGSRTTTARSSAAPAPRRLNATAFSILAPATWQSWRKSLMVQKWMLGVSHQA